MKEEEIPRKEGLRDRDNAGRLWFSLLLTREAEPLRVASGCMTCLQPPRSLPRRTPFWLPQSCHARNTFLDPTNCCPFSLQYLVFWLICHSRSPLLPRYLAATWVWIYIHLLSLSASTTMVGVSPSKRERTIIMVRLS